MKKINNDIYIRTLEFINEKKLISRGERVLLSLSAGKDSMTLFDIFLHLQADLSIDIAVFHLNHMMRGDESDEDESFILKMAKERDVEIFIERFDFKNEKRKGHSFEEFARTKRYEFLDKICKENNFQKIATAHNRDDNIETILMRIFSGTGINGLSGIDHKRGNIIRPLLFLSSREIYEHLIDKKIMWREDSSNKDNRYLRNYIRNSLLPEIQKRFGNVDESVLTLSRTAREYSSIINELLYEKEGELYTFEGSDVIIDKERFLRDKRIFKIVLLKAIRERFEEFITTGVLEEIYKNAITGKSHALLYGNRKLLIKKTIINKKKVIVISGGTGYNKNKIEWEYKLELGSNANKKIFIREIDSNIYLNHVKYDYFLRNKDSKNIIFVGLNENINDLVIRNRRNGDRIKLEHGIKKIKELMIDNKLDTREKESVPLLVIDSHVAVYMPGLVMDLSNRVSVDFHVKNGSKKIFSIHK